jgi:hypothetical protein
MAASFIFKDKVILGCLAKKSTGVKNTMLQGFISLSDLQRLLNSYLFVCLVEQYSWGAVR